jgi:hypothetical protein
LQAHRKRDDFVAVADAEAPCPRLATDHCALPRPSRVICTI